MNLLFQLNILQRPSDVLNINSFQAFFFNLQQYCPMAKDCNNEVVTVMKLEFSKRKIKRRKKRRMTEKEEANKIDTTAVVGRSTACP